PPPAGPEEDGEARRRAAGRALRLLGRRGDRLGRTRPLRDPGEAGPGAVAPAPRHVSSGRARGHALPGAYRERPRAHPRATVRPEGLRGRSLPRFAPPAALLRRAPRAYALLGRPARARRRLRDRAAAGGGLLRRDGPPRTAHARPLGGGPRGGAARPFRRLLRGFLRLRVGRICHLERV